MTLYALHTLGEFLSIAVQIPVLCLSLSCQLRGPPAQCLRALRVSTHELMDLQKLLKTGGVAVRLKFGIVMSLTEDSSCHQHPTIHEAIHDPSSSDIMITVCHDCDCLISRQCQLQYDLENNSNSENTVAASEEG